MPTPQFGRIPTTLGFSRSASITPNNATVLDPIPRALIFGTTGNAALQLGEDSAPTTIPVLAGTVYFFEAQIVAATGHTAGTVVALY